MNIYYLTQLLRVRNFRVAKLGGSGRVSQLRLQGSCCPGLKSSGGSTGPSWIPFHTRSSGYWPASVFCSLLAGRWLQFLATWPLYWLPHNKWSEREKSNPNRSCSVFYNLITEMTYQHFCVLLVTQTNPSTRWERMHKGANTRRQGPLDIVLEAGYYSFWETLRSRLFTSFIKELTVFKNF